MKALILIAASFIIGLYCIKLLRAYDIHEKEPFSKMLMVVVVGGISSVVISLLLYKYVNGFPIRKLVRYKTTVTFNTKIDCQLAPRPALKAGQAHVNSLKS
jgi:hypothetical protein